MAQQHHNESETEYLHKVYGERRRRIDGFEDEAKDVFADSLRSIADAERDGDKTVKLFGMVEVPAVVSVIGSSAYNLFSKFGADYIQDSLYRGTNRALSKHVSSSAASKSAAVATLAVTVGLKSGAYMVPFFTSLVRHHKEDADRTREIAPVLDELKGNHSQLAYMMVGGLDNTVIAAHKRRMAKVYRSENMANITRLLLNAGLNLAPDFKLGRDMWAHGKSPSELEHMAQAKLAAERKRYYQTGYQEHEVEPELQALQTGPRSKMGEALNYFLTVGGPPLSEFFAARHERRKQALQEHPSAFEMIVALEQQISHNPDAHVQAPREHRSYSLEAYIMKVILTHQKELAEVDPRYAELRSGLRAELGELVKPIAAAVREGQISALTLMHLVGEPHKFPLILERGHALTSQENVESMIEKLAGKKSNTRIVNVEDFLVRHETKEAELRKAFETLKGEERTRIAALFPDSVQEKMGITPQEMKAIQEFRKSPEYDQFLRELMVAVAHTDEKELKKGGLTAAKIKRLDRSAEQVQGDPEAIKKLKSSIVNPDGIENELIDWALPKIEGKALHLGTFASRGAQLLTEHAPLPERSFVKKEREGIHESNPADELADELPGGHANRERDRREQAYDGYDDGYGRD